MIVAFQQEVGQAKLGKVGPKQRIEKLIGRLDIRRPGIQVAQRLQGGRNLMDRLAHRRFPAVGFGCAEQIIGELVSGVAQQHRLLAEVILDLPPPPGQFGEWAAFLEFLFQAVEQSDADQIFVRLVQAPEMIAGALREIGADVRDKYPVKNLCRRMRQRFGKGLQNRQVGRPFNIEDPAGLLGLVELVESEVCQRLEHLAARGR